MVRALGGSADVEDARAKLRSAASRVRFDTLPSVAEGLLLPLPAAVGRKRLLGGEQPHRP